MLIQESQLDVTFGPTSEPLTSEATLMIHVEPSGPDYNLKLKGVALHVPPSHVDTPPVLSVRTLTLPETEVGGCSEGVLDIHNPYPSTLQWTLTPVASPFLRKVGVSLCHYCSVLVHNGCPCLCPMLSMTST